MRKLMLFSAGFAAAALLCVFLLPPVCLWAIGASALMTAAGFFFRGLTRRRTVSVCLGLFCGFVWCAAYFLLFLAPLEALTGKTRAFSATAADVPAQTGYGWRVDADLLLPHRRVRTVLYFSEQADILPGDTLTGSASFSRTAEEKDTYQISNDVFLTGSVRGSLAVLRSERVPLRYLPAAVSLRIRERVQEIFPADSAGFFAALVTGDRSGMDYALRNEMILGGIYHSVSLSGMHVSVLAGVIFLLLGAQRKAAAAAAIPVLALFVMLTGGAPATVRAALMQTVLLLAPLAEREYDPLTALSAALLLLLLQNPWAAAHWGLQLSFLSALGIILFMPLLSERIFRKENRKYVYPAPVRTLFSALALTLSASAFSLPLSAAYFGVASLLSPLVNLLTLWAVTVCFVGGLLAVAVSFLWMPAAVSLGWTLAWCFRWVRLVVHTVAALPFCAVYAETPLLCLWAVFSTLLALSAILLRTGALLPSAAAALTLLCAMLLTWLPDRTAHRFTVLDVGQGQSIILQSGENAVVIDCGAAGDASGELAARYLLSHGIRRLDALILTHFDRDHCNGVSQLLSRIPVQTLVYPVETADSLLRTAVLEKAEECGTGLFGVTEKQELSYGDAVLTVFPPLSHKNDNERGLSLLASAAEYDILITGDMSTATEAMLLTKYDLPDLEILVAGHHGSADSTGEALLQSLLPETVLISAGEDNPFGHPAPETLSRIAAIGAQSCCTAENGNLEIRW